LTNAVRVRITRSGVTTRSSGQHHRPRVHGSCLAGEREFQIAVAAALADASATRVHGHAARHDEIDVPQLLRRDGLAQPCGAFDGRRLSQPRAEARRIEAKKTTLVGETRHCHEHGLAFSERAQAQGSLRSVRIAFEPPGALPLR
jgi:hypothetical protein